MTDPFQTWAQGEKKVTDNSQKFCPCKHVTNLEGNGLNQKFQVSFTRIKNKQNCDSSI